MIELLQEIGNFAKKTLDGISLDDRAGESRFPEFKLYIGRIYGHGMEPRAEEFPLILVRLLDVTDEDAGDGTAYSLAQVRIIVGVWNEGQNAEGYHDLLNCLFRLSNALFERRVLAKKYELTGKVTTATFEDESEPFWFGDIVCHWAMRRMKANPMYWDIERGMK